MDYLNGIIQFEIKDFGSVRVKLAEILDARGITRYHLCRLTGVKYTVVDRYYKNKNIAWVDLDFLAKVCCVLDCKIEDLLEYQPPE